MMITNRFFQTAYIKVTGKMYDESMGNIKDEEVEKEIQRLEREELKKEINIIYDSLMKKIPYLIDKDITEEKIKAYKMKFDRAKEYKAGKTENKKYFESEAEALGIDIDTLIDKIIYIGNLYQDNYNEMSLKLDSARVFLSNIYKLNLVEEYKKGLEWLKNVNKNSTIQELMNITTNGKTIKEIQDEK